MRINLSRSRTRTSPFSDDQWHGKVARWELEGRLGSEGKQTHCGQERRTVAQRTRRVQSRTIDIQHLVRRDTEELERVDV